MTFSEVVLSPCSEVGVLDGIALGKSRSHEVLCRAMHADFGRHAADDGNSIRNPGSLGQVLGNLEVGLGSDRITRPLGRPGLWIKGVNVAHASFDLQEDDALGLAESVPSANWFCRAQVGQNGKPEGA